MPECSNCESFVTEDYVRVFATGDSVDVCPFCPDKVRGRAGRARDARSDRGQRATGAVDSHDVATDGGETDGE